MRDSSYDIESIVKQVLAEIKAATADKRTVNSPLKKGATAGLSSSECKQLPENTAGQASSGTQAGKLVINAPVVSLAQVEGRLEGAGRLVVPCGAVVTPSVRDLLREKNVALTFSTGTDEKVKGGRCGGVSLSLMATLVKPALKFDLAALGRGLQNDGIDVKVSTSDCLIETTDRFAAMIKDRSTIGAIITSHPAPGLCLANRLRGVRAIGPATAADVTRDAKGVGANLIVINPAGRGIFQIKQMIREFCLDGPRKCPPAIAQRLK